MTSIHSFATGFSPIFIAYLILIALSVGLVSQAQPSTPKTYDFRVYLDDDVIGNQRFEVYSEGDKTKISVEASFDVTILFIPFYTYRHTNCEIWEGDCLKEIRAKTNDNGESFFVQGNSNNDQFQLETHNGESTLKGCVKTFAYWNPDWFQNDRLLNSQTGELQPVKVTTVGKETISVRGAPTPTEHQRIVSDKFTIDLWYTADREWVALQSTTKTGKKLRYQLK